MIDKDIQDYAERFTSDESPVLREIRLRTFAERDDRSMLSGFYQGRLLSMFSKMIRPRRILEIGTYMGYSALCLAEGLSDDGKVITLDIDEGTNAIAQSFWARTEFGKRIEAHIGPATEILPAVADVLDLVFIDADKENYSAYYDLAFPKLRTGGLIIADNVLWSGEVLNSEKGKEVDSATRALHEYSQKINEDTRVCNILLAVRDGLMVARKEVE